MGQEGLGKGEASGRDDRIFRKMAEAEVEGRVWGWREGHRVNKPLTPSPRHSLVYKPDSVYTTNVIF